MGRPRIAAVMTVFNRRDVTLECLRSLDEQRDLDAELHVVVVDDASPDGTADAVAEQYPDVELLHGDGTLYWNGGMHLAYGAALSRGYDYYLWLNDDTRLDPDAVSRLVATQEWLSDRGDPPAIVVGSTRHPVDGRLTYGGRHRPSAWRPMHFTLVQPKDTPQPADTMNGNCVLIPRSVARAVGNVDPAFRQQMGDYDYGLRAQAGGIGIWVAPGTIGTCATHPERRTDDQPLRDEVRRLWSIKELTPSAWQTFTRRHAGPLWLMYFVSPYVRRSLRLVREKLVSQRRTSGA